MKLKICGLKTPENILQVLKLKPDFIGFIFYEGSPRYAGKELSPDFAQSISSAKKVGVFVNESEINVMNAVSRYGLDYVQMHGNETHEFCERLQKNVEIIKAFRIEESFDFSLLHDYQNVCSHFLFDTYSKTYGGSGKTFNWNKLRDYTAEKSIFLSGGIDLKNIDEVTGLSSQIPHLFAVDVNSCFESEPGIKDINKIKELTAKINKYVVRG